MDADDKADKNKYKQSKILWKAKPKSLSGKSGQNNNIIQYKVNSIEDKENEVDMEVSSQIEAKDEKASESYYSKGMLNLSQKQMYTKKLEPDSGSN